MLLSVEEIIVDLCNSDKPLLNSRLSDLSNLSPEDLKLFEQTWGTIELKRRRQIVNRLVDLTEDNLYTCSEVGLNRIKENIRDLNLNRIVVASCTPRTHEPLFRDTINEEGLNPYLFEMANIRDQCTWVHMKDPEKAMKKAKDLIRMAVGKARLLTPLKKIKVSVTPSA